MDTSKLVPHDPRVREETAQVRGKTYSYLIGEPCGFGPQRQAGTGTGTGTGTETETETETETVMLLHGFPDLALGWRCQIPFLLSLGLRVVAPNMLGYAGTSRPDDVTQWSFKNVADDVAALAEHVAGGRP
ncbi:hypothetical protein E4U42_007400, partial [Claviceps africana]